VARLLGAGYLSTLLSRPILSGYLLGIAILMIASQLGHLTGLPVFVSDQDRLGRRVGADHLFATLPTAVVAYQQWLDDHPTAETPDSQAPLVARDPTPDD
jgi:MFS superfamily sulfate permease-like transporter